MTFRPTLPPRAGYIEVEEDGVRKYRQVYIEIEPVKEDPQADTDALLIDHEFRLTLLELGV